MKKRIKMVQRRRLSDDMITVHNKPNNRTITFNRNLSLFLIEQGLDAVELKEFDGTLYFSFFEFDKDKKLLYESLAKLHYHQKYKRALVTICNYNMVTRLCKHYYLEEGDYYFKIEGISPLEGEKYQLYSIRVCGVFDIPTNEKQKIIEPISNFAYKISIDKATDQQLYDELIRRGYEGEMSKHILLTKANND